MIRNKNLERDYNYCKDIIYKFSKTFSLAFNFLEEDKRRAVWSIYAFNRELDDIVDKYKSKEKLEESYKDFITFLDGDDIDTPIYRTLRDVFNKFDMDSKPFLDMFKGQNYDTDFKEFKNDKELIKYCYKVAGSVGLMLTPILSSKNNGLVKKSAIQIGIAMQITNILRDVKEDYLNNRIYLSKDIIKKYNFDITSLENNEISESYIKVFEHYANIAKEFYEKGLYNIDLFDRDSKFVIKSACIAYGGILDKIRESGYNYNIRVSLTKKEKLKLIGSL